MMRTMLIAALGATALACSMPLAAQEMPMTGGGYWTVQDINVDDGHSGDYADYLAGTYRKNMDWQRSKGYIRDYKILENVNKRSGEADLYLVTMFDHMPTNAEVEARRVAQNAFLATTDRAMDASSGERAKYRHRGSSLLLQEQVWRH